MGYSMKKFLVGGVAGNPNTLAGSSTFGHTVEAESNGEASRQVEAYFGDKCVEVSIQFCMEIENKIDPQKDWVLFSEIKPPEHTEVLFTDGELVVSGNYRMLKLVRTDGSKYEWASFGTFGVRGYEWEHEFSGETTPTHWRYLPSPPKKGI